MFDDSSISCLTKEACLLRLLRDTNPLILQLSKKNSPDLPKPDEILKALIEAQDINKYTFATDFITFAI